MKNILILFAVFSVACTEIETITPEDKTTSFSAARDKLADWLVDQNIDVTTVQIRLDFMHSYQVSDPQVKYIFEFPNSEYCEDVTRGRIVIIDPEAK